MNIIEIARSTGILPAQQRATGNLEAFAAEVRREALEEAAIKCETSTWSMPIEWWMTTTKKKLVEQAALECTAAIRSLAK